MDLAIFSFWDLLIWRSIADWLKRNFFDFFTGLRYRGICSHVCLSTRHGEKGEGINLLIRGEIIINTFK